MKAAQARQRIATLLAAEKRSAGLAERKARNHRLIQQGVLFDMAGLANRSRGELLGLLMGGTLEGLENARRRFSGSIGRAIEEQRAKQIAFIVVDRSRRRYSFKKMR